MTATTRTYKLSPESIVSYDLEPRAECFARAVMAVLRGVSVWYECADPDDLARTHVQFVDALRHMGYAATSTPHTEASKAIGVRVSRERGGFFCCNIEGWMRTPDSYGLVIKKNRVVRETIDAGHPARNVP